MEISHGHTDSEGIGWLRSLVRYSVSLAAAALVLAILVEFSGGLKGDAHPTAQASRSSSLLRRQPPKTASISVDTKEQQRLPQAIYYLVSSQAESELAASTEQDRSRERASISAPEPHRVVEIFFVATEAQEKAALYHIATTDMEGMPFTLVDLRGR
jgi:hypothetical protein